ncbi:hypothetical protein DMP19_11840 [Enterococcus faecium]|nr:hypothetical protein DMP19_11840 [Enterococcus faecium]
MLCMPMVMHKNPSDKSIWLFVNKD